MPVTYDMQVPRQPEVQRPQAYTDFLLSTQRWEFGGKHLKIPVSGHDSGHLALAYGFPDLEAFCADLPKDANVLDVGAGVAPLGVDVCRRRPDVHWTSADIFYRNESAYDRLRSDSPPNLTLLPADAVDLAAATGKKGYDRVLSQHLFLHLWRVGSEPVLTTARQMLGATATTGKLSIGPVKAGFNASSEKDPYRLTGQAITLNAPANDEALEDSAALIARATRLPKVAVRSLLGFIK